jgi:hypothetical protein
VREPTSRAIGSFRKEDAVTPLQWIGLTLGLLIVVTRLPLLIWPEPILGWLLAALARNPRVILRSWGAFLCLLALAIGLTIASPLSVLEQVMALLAALFVGFGVVSLLFPESTQQFVEQIWGGVAPRVVRTAAGIGVGFGVWLAYLSLSA